MDTRGKVKLVRLLHAYMDELGTVALIGKTTQLGLKSQYEHARIIATKLAKEINDEIKGYW